MSETATVENQTPAIAARPNLQITLKAEAVNEEIGGHNEVRLRDEETTSVAVIRGDGVKGFFARGANYRVTIEEIPAETEEQSKQEVAEGNNQPPPPQQQHGEQQNGESNDSAKPNTATPEAGSGGSSKKK